MPRPRRRRRIYYNPDVTFFKPAGVRMKELSESILTLDEFEAVRLKDLEGLDQKDCAKKMNISQPTFHRLVLSARKKIADAIVNGKAIKIEGGNVKIIKSRGKIKGSALGPGGICICEKCKYEQPHKTGIPCNKIKCPECKSRMIRK